MVQRFEKRSEGERDSKLDPFVAACASNAKPIGCGRAKVECNEGPAEWLSPLHEPTQRLVTLNVVTKRRTQGGESAIEPARPWQAESRPDGQAPPMRSAVLSGSETSRGDPSGDGLRIVASFLADIAPFRVAPASTWQANTRHRNVPERQAACTVSRGRRATQLSFPLWSDRHKMEAQPPRKKGGHARGSKARRRGRRVIRKCRGLGVGFHSPRPLENPCDRTRLSHFGEQNARAARPAPPQSLRSYGSDL